MSFYKGRKSAEPTTQRFLYGIRLLKLNRIEIIESKKPEGRVAHVFHMETPPVSETFKGATDDTTGHTAKGLVGRVMFGQWFNPERTDDDYDSAKKEQFLDDVVLLAEKVEAREKLDEIAEDATWAEMIEHLESVLKDKYIWVLVTGEENDKGMFNLSFGTIPIGKDEQDKPIFSLIVKHQDFHKGGDKVISKDDNGIMTEVRGLNVIGENKGAKANIKFEEKFHLKRYKAGDGDGLNLDPSKHDDLPF